MTCVVGECRERPKSWAKGKKSICSLRCSFTLGFFGFGSASSLEAAKRRNATCLSPGCQPNIREHLNTLEYIVW